jgi:large subunit ribosomal protein L23
MKVLSNVIIKPLISEKAFNEAKVGRYTFVVAKHATKTDVKNAVEKLFGVNVLHVYSANIKGSKVRATKFTRKTLDASYKKARVKLAQGQKIDVFEEKTDDKKESKKEKKEKGEGK